MKFTSIWIGCMLIIAVIAAFISNKEKALEKQKGVKSAIYYNIVRKTKI